MIPADSTKEKRKIYKVFEINHLANLSLENEFGFVWVEGELSRVTKSQPGHIYFSLKDEQATVSAALFKGDQRELNFELKDGLKVLVYGRLSIYEPRGQYQIIARKIEEYGKGSLQEAFERLKKKLAAEGLFDAARKKPIPTLPQHIGIVTSPTGAAIRDILNILTRRYPNLHVILAPVKVQGEGAAEEIAAAIQLFNQRADVDVLIVGRGGGSLEDLWAFNEEVVARAVAASNIPVISAVGHEIDFTICDFVADLRAPTPSAAAELVVGQKEAFEKNLRELSRQLGRSLQARALEFKNRLTAARKSYVFREPQNLIRQYRQRIDGCRQNFLHLARRTLQFQQQRLDEDQLRFRHHLEIWRSGLAQKLARLHTHLNALSPRAILQRGFSISYDAAGTILRSPEQIGVGELLRTRLAAGTLESKVTATHRGEDHDGEKRRT